MRRRLREVVDRAPLAPTANEAEAPEAAQDLDRRVGADAEDREERLGGSVAAQQHDAGSQRA